MRSITIAELINWIKCEIYTKEDLLNADVERIKQNAIGAIQELEFLKWQLEEGLKPPPLVRRNNTHYKKF